MSGSDVEASPLNVARRLAASIAERRVPEHLTQAVQDFIFDDVKHIFLNHVEVVPHVAPGTDNTAAIRIAIDERKFRRAVTQAAEDRKLRHVLFPQKGVGLD